MTTNLSILSEFQQNNEADISGVSNFSITVTSDLSSFVDLMFYIHKTRQEPLRMLLKIGHENRPRLEP